MQLRFLFLWCLLIVSVIISAEAGGDHHKHVKIYVPYHVKTIKHTHTIYKTIHHKEHGGGGEHHAHDHKDHGHGGGGWF